MIVVVILRAARVKSVVSLCFSARTCALMDPSYPTPALATWTRGPIGVAGRVAVDARAGVVVSANPSAVFAVLVVISSLAEGIHGNARQRRMNAHKVSVGALN